MTHGMTKTQTDVQTERLFDCRKIRKQIDLNTENQIYLKIILPVFVLLFTACNPSDRHGYQTTEEALSDYSGFLKEIEHKKRATTDELIAVSQQWHSMGDSVMNCIARDSVAGKSNHAGAEFGIITDSIRLNIGRLVDSRPRSFKDYMKVMAGVSNVEVDTTSLRLINTVHRFYQRMDSIPLPSVSRIMAVKGYEKMLDDAWSEGFETKRDVFLFLQNEDVVFRRFLCHLHALGEVPLDSIKTKSARISNRILGLVIREHPVFTKSEVVILLTMRNNRRIIQNADKCLEDIRTIHIADNNQATAYLWMLLQPWVTLDEFSYALLSQRQIESLEKIAEKTPSAVDKLKGSRFPIEVSELPSMLIKAFITYPR